MKIFGRRPRTNDCSSSSCPTEAVVRINEIDSARNMNELKSSISSLRLIIPDFEILDSHIANALKKGLTADFKRGVYMEEMKTQQDTRFLKGRQIAYMTFDYFKISGTGEALLHFNDPLRVRRTMAACKASTPSGTKYLSP